MNTTLTSGQLALQLKVFEEKGMTPERFGKILSSGLFADLCDSGADISNRAVFRTALKLNTAPIRATTLTVGFDQILELTIADGNYDRKKDHIMSKRFPLRCEGVVQFKRCYFHFGRGISSHEATRLIEEVGWEVAQKEHLRVHGEQFPEDSRKFSIIALGSAKNSRQGSYLSEDGSVRNIYYDGEYTWNRKCRFLAVREIA